MVQMEDNLPPIEKRFHDPPNEFRMMPFWFWNHEIRKNVVELQIKDFYSHGSGGIFIHPRHGRLTPYLGKTWLENVEAAADLCKELNIPCFLYDEDNWPSGPVSGTITGPDRPENRAKFLVLMDEDDFTGPNSIEYEFDPKQIDPEAEFFAAIAYPTSETYGKLQGIKDNVIDLTNKMEGTLLKWDVPEGEWTVSFFCIVKDSWEGSLNGYIDALRKETVEEFIEKTHKKYTSYFIEKGKEDYLGTVIPGIFTDEPSMIHNSNRVCQLNKWIPFTWELPEHFKEMFGYDFNTTLLSLFYDTDDDNEAMHRCHFWQCATDLYVNAFFKQIYDYCDKFNWRFTGHVNDEGGMPNHFRQQGDFFKVFRYLHYGGCDQLTESVRPEGIEDLWEINQDPYIRMAGDVVLASKLASSAAHLYKKPRVLVEAFGSSSWDIRLAGVKKVSDYLIATGCDLFTPHSFNYSEDGYRKQDHPPAFNYQPYYAHWDKVTDHNARLSALLNAHSGILNINAVVFYPANTFYSEFNPLPTDISNVLGKYIQHNVDCLYRQQIDFEIANEDLISEARIDEDSQQAIISEEPFDMLVLNASTCISITFAKWLKRFFDAGGKILATATLPFKEAEKAQSKEVIEIIQSIFGVNPVEEFQKFKDKEVKDIELIKNNGENGGQAIFIRMPYGFPFKYRYYPVFEEACRMLVPLSKRHVSVWKDYESKKHAAYVMAVHKTVEGKELFFLTNTSNSIGYRECIVELHAPYGTLEHWDTMEGTITPLTNYSYKEGTYRIRLSFPLYQSYLLVVTPKSSQSKGDTKETNTNTELPSGLAIPLPSSIMNESKNIITLKLDGLWDFSLGGPNVAMLKDRWKTSIQSEALEAWVYQSKRISEHTFYVENIEKINTLKVVIDGLVGDYIWGKSTTMELKGGDKAHFTIPRGLYLLVNGKRVSIKHSFKPLYLDPAWIVIDIKKYLSNGENTIALVHETHLHEPFHMVTDPWRLIGDFKVIEKEGIPYLSPIENQIELGDLTQKGYGRSHGPIHYKKEISMPSDYKGFVFLLEITKTIDCIEVWINGELFDVLWNKWTCDISNAIKTGETNKIELVYYGIALNTLHTNTKPTGLMGDVLIHIIKP